MEAFAGKLLLSGLVGGLVVSATTIAGERFGGKVGGFIGGLPSAVMVIYLFMGWVQGPQAAYAATAAFPLTYTIGIFCVFLYIVQRSSSLPLAILAFVGVWSILQAAGVLANFDAYPGALAIWAVFLSFILIYLRAGGATLIARGAGARLQGMSLLMRAVIGSSIIMMAVFLSRIGGPVLGSVFAAFSRHFPVDIDRGPSQRWRRFLPLTACAYDVRGMVNCITYVAVFRRLLLDLGIVPATLASAGAVLVSGLMSKRLIDWVCSARVPPAPPI